MFPKFWKKKTTEGASPTLADVGNVPDTAYERAKRDWFERNGDATVNQSRFFLLSLLLLICLVLMATAIATMLPLKTVVPYSITVDVDTGRTTATEISASKYIPDQNQKSYFLSRWVRQVLSLDPFTTERDLREAFAMVRGKAIGEFREFLTATKPVGRITEDRTLTRVVDVSSIQFIDENIAQVRVITRERSANTSAVSKRHIVTMHFVLEPPASIDQILANPIGIYVVHFSITEEMR